MNNKISVDFKTITGEIKPLNGVGQPPLSGIDTSHFGYLREANIPYSRLHDVGGWFGGNLFVDIPNIFRDFNADENDGSSYDFAFTDLLISALEENKCEPIYRLGVSIENFHEIRAYRIFPPQDYRKWAVICEHIIRHYNEGWANGFHYNIRYWEIWNEPDGSPQTENNEMWKGTKEQYFDLYRITSKHLRSCFGDSVKIGGYASCGFYWVNDVQNVSGEAFGTGKPLNDWQKRIYYFVTFFNEFIEIVTKEKLPFDFFSYHSYEQVENTMNMQHYVGKRLREAGLENTEIHLNEWNTNPRVEERGKSEASADTAAMMCAMQNTEIKLMCYYDARIGVSVYGGLFDPLTTKPFCVYYSFKAFGELRKLKNQVKCDIEGEGLYAAASTDGSRKCVLIANTGDDKVLTTDLEADMTVYLIDEEHHFEKTDLGPQNLPINKNQVLFISKE